MSNILHLVCAIHELRFWQGGGVIKIKDAILAHAKKVVAPPEAFHRLTPDEQAAFYVLLSCC